MSETEPKFRYNAAMAQDIETKWQKKWDDEGTFWAANVAGDLKDGKGRNAEGRPSYFAMDMFPYPSGKGTIIYTGSLEEGLTDERLSELFNMPIEVEHSHGRWAAYAV